MVEEQKPRLHLRHVRLPVHRHLDPSQRSSFHDLHPSKGRGSPCRSSSADSPCNLHTLVRGVAPRTPAHFFMSSLPHAKPAQCTTRRNLTLPEIRSSEVRANPFQSLPHLGWKRGGLAGLAVHVD